MVRRSAVFVGVLSVLALTACSSVDWEDRYGELHDEMLVVVAERDAKQQELVEAYTREEALKQQTSLRDRDFNDSRRKIADATQRANEYANQNAEYARRMAELQRANDDLVAKLNAQPTPAPTGEAEGLKIAVGELEREGYEPRLTPDGNIEIRLDSDVTFGSGLATLTNGGKKSLRGLTSVLTGRFAPYQIRVEGHTDNQPLRRTKAKWGDNFGLASARSLEVVRFLEREANIEPTRLMSASRGQHEPIASNKDKAGRAQNRRVEIVVVIPQEAAQAMAK